MNDKFEKRMEVLTEKIGLKSITYIEISVIKRIEFNKEKDNRTFAFMNKLVDIKLLNLDVLGVKSSKYALE